MKLQNLAALITGGSRGLGRALGKTLSSAEARVVLVARHHDGLDEMVAWIRSQDGEAYVVAADVADKSAVYSIVGQAAAFVRTIDLLINNATSTLERTPMPLLLDTECEDLEDVLQTNLVGPFRLSKAVIGSMVLRCRGMVLNISSDVVIESYPTWGPYGVSKAGLEHMTRIWAAELDELSKIVQTNEIGVELFSLDPVEMNTQMQA